ncbi:MAG TPA: 30S ribosomal protein S5 [Candidatus Saccharimonadales bacterium]|nr:30S ribosomal protein S5 [Candidatus Saccharimonadales bacterium]
MAEDTTAVQKAASEQQAQNTPNNGPQRGGPRGGGRGQGPRGRRPEVAPEEKQFDERVVHIDRVARVVKGGRRFRFRALVVVGDRKNRVGIGTAKGADVTAAVTKATEIAKKHFVLVPVHNDTIPHEVTAKVSGANILVKPASPGTGLIAGGTVRIVLEVAGIKNALSKSLGSSNKTNAAYATVAALQTLVPASQWVTRMNAKKTAAPKAAEKAVEKKAPAAKPAAKKAETK